MSHQGIDLAMPSVGAPQPGLPLRLDLNVDGQERTLWMIDVGLACCSLEVMAAALRGSATRRAGGIQHGVEGQGVDVLVVSGTCTDVLAPLVRRIYDSLPGSPLVVSFGACSNSGGPYWDSYSVIPGVEELFPVDLVVPGCPPPPSALIDALVAVAR